MIQYISYKDTNESEHEMTRLRALLFGVVTVAVATSHSQANAGINDIIFSGCASAMRKEYQQAGRQLLLSELNRTCRCVVGEINKRQSIEMAKRACINTDETISRNQDRQML